MFKKMDSTQIDIAKLHDLKMVHIYDVTGGLTSRGEKGITGMAIYYGENEKLNINEQDSHFFEYVNKVFELLADEETKERVSMDDATRRIIEEGLKLECEDGLDSFYKLCPVPYPVLSYDSKLSERFLPLAEYLITGLYKSLGTELQIHTRKAGYRGASLLLGMVNGNRRTFFYRVYKLSEDTYTMGISNVPTEGTSLRVDITYDLDKLLLSYRAADESLIGKTELTYSSNGVTDSSSVWYQGKEVYYGCDVYECGTEDLSDNERKILLKTSNGLKVWKLPWGVTCVYSIRENDDDEVKAEAKCVTYIYADGKYADIKGHTSIHNKTTDVRVRTDGIRLTRLLMNDGKIQTTFSKCLGNTSGKYKENLEGKTFISDESGEDDK